MSNSPLVSYTKLSPNCTKPRNHVIDTVTIHCFVGQVTAKSGCNASHFVNYDPKNGASCNYVVGYDGSIGLCVEEANRSWCSSNKANDHRAITIEVASDTTDPYKVTDKAYAALIDLLVDVCKRNNIKQLLWKGDKNLIGKVDQQNMTVHRWFAAKSCPGNYLYNKHPEIAQKVNDRLNNTEKEDDDMAVVYEKLGDVPDSYRPSIQKLMEKGALVGYSNPDPSRLDDNIINVSEDLCRTIKILDSLGLIG